MADQERLYSQWARLGAMFNIRAVRQTPDIEHLLVETAAAVPGAPRLLGMTTAWLVRYYRLVCRHRLAVMAKAVDSPEASAALGYLLSVARDHGGTDHFNLAIRACRPLPTPQPLYNVYRRNDDMTRLARLQTDPLAKRWGLWAPPERGYDDAIRPAEWVMDTNPALKIRATFGGQLAASIIVTLRANPDAGQSESALARTCRATRVAIRDALDHLELCRLVNRHRVGRAARIELLT